MEDRALVRKVVEAVDEFIGRGLWKRFTNLDCFAVRTAGPACPDPSPQDEPMLGVVMGAGGEEYGLSLFLGPRAAASFAALVESDGLGDDVSENLHMLSFSMETFGDLPPESQALLRDAGLYPRFGDPVPHFLVKPRQCLPRLPDESEFHLLLLALRAVSEADKKKLLRPARLDDKNGICVLEISGDTATPQVSVTRERLQTHSGSKTIPLLPETRDLRSLPRLDATWLAGMPTLPVGVQGDDRIMQMLLVVDEASEYVLQGEPVIGGDLRGALKILVETFRSGGLGGRKGLPRRIIFSSRKLHDAIAPTLEPVGVKCVYEPEIPKLQEIVSGLIEHLDRSPLLSAEGTEAPGPQEAQIPAPDDLKAWKEADLRLYGRFAEYFESGTKLQTSRAGKRYFDDDDLEFYFKEHEKLAVVQAYTAWGVLDYRPTKTSKTHAEKMMATGLPKPEAILLSARMEACPTLYRVAGRDPKAGTTDLEDVLLGGTVTVHDQALSGNDENVGFLVARVFPAGRFHFIELAGPPLGPAMGMEAVEFLRGCGMEFTPEGLRRDAHLFGWLWGWMDEWKARSKSTRLRNTDGEEFLWHIASFSVADPDQTRKALLRRKDIAYDEEADQFVWSKDVKPGGAMLGDTVTLGRMEWVGDELVITVNSAQRFAVARKWLEGMSGVVFRAVKTRRWDEPEKDRPMDERMSRPKPVEMTPGLNAALQELMDRHYKGWIDTPLPALAGRTPRQACRTEAGRQEVAMLIRTMPDPRGPGSVRVPREAMLRELGLTTEAATPPAAGHQGPQAPPSMEAAPQKPKAPRNAPCPCGSGRKYKKCCGR